MLAYHEVPVAEDYKSEKWQLIVCFVFNGPLRQYFSLYLAVSKSNGERGREKKISTQPPPAPTAIAIGPCPTTIQFVGRPGT